MSEATDNRLIGIHPYMSESALKDDTHQRVKAMLLEDFRDFLKAPTNTSLNIVIQQLLSYQDSFLLGPRRNTERKPRAAG